MTYFETFLFGITLAISIGPIAILILNQSINCGLKNGALCGLGAASADLTYAVVAFTAGSFLVSFLNEGKSLIPFVSAAVLIVFGAWMIFSTLRKKKPEKGSNYTLVCKWPFATTYGLTIANPLTIVVFAGFAGMISTGSPGRMFMHAAVIFTASLLVQMLIALAGSKLSRFLARPSVLLYFNLASGLGILLFGAVKLL